jgi:hypothetical protein
MDSDEINGDEGGRRADRLPLDAETRLRPNGWSSLAVQMVDLSESGFRARCEARLMPGSGVSLDVPGIGAVEAQVEWQRGGDFGARFFTSLALDRCEWSLADRHQALARLLVQRAAAKRAGRSSAERRIRETIRTTLPMRAGRLSG